MILVFALAIAGSGLACSFSELRVRSLSVESEDAVDGVEAETFEVTEVTVERSIFSARLSSDGSVGVLKWKSA